MIDKTMKGAAMKRLPRARLIAVGALIAASTVGAAASTTEAGIEHSAGATKAAQLTAHSSRYGRILFDGRGRVLYLFARDRGGRSSCSGACAEAWPPFLTKGAPKALSGVNAKLVGTLRRSDGKLQVTYAKHPLYYYEGDTKPGQIKCQNVSEFGGLWLVVAPSGKPVR
jgi:predicted lipoprotein with Yx(FWY)xxD motif